MELLAPARRFESVVSAFDAGADAVYIGVPAFNARRMANEVTFEDLSKIVGYAHSLGKKVYAALNILIKDIELKNAIKSLEYLDAIKVDAVIFQDPMFFELKKYFPSLAFHASTQTAFFNSYTLNEIEKLGIERVILPREVSIDEIKTIRKNINIELEVFIHGALCHSVSGMCLFSGSFTGKSGNRGMCIQICRKNFIDKNKQEKTFFFHERFMGRREGFIIKRLCRFS